MVSKRDGYSLLLLTSIHRTRIHTPEKMGNPRRNAERLHGIFTFLHHNSKWKYMDSLDKLGMFLQV